MTIQETKRAAAVSTDNVIALRAHIGRALDLTNPIGQLTVERGLTSDWTAMLSNPEMRVFQRIVRMTSGFGRLAYQFTYRQFIDGNGTFAGLPMGETQIRAALKGLEASGHIVIDPDRRAGLNITLKLDRLYTMLATPKRLKSQGQDGVETPSEKRNPLPRKTVPPSLGKPRPILEQELEPIQNHLLVDAVAPTEVPVSKIEENGGKVEPRRLLPAKPVRLAPAGPDVPNPLRLNPDPKRGSIKEPTLSALSLEATWRKAFADSQQAPGTVLKAWTVVDKGKITSALSKSWTATPAQLHQFVGWAAGNWPRIMTGVFAWMTKRLPPTRPELGFFIVHRERFLDAFNRNVIAADREKLTDREQREVRLLIDERGYTRDEAFKAVARDQAVGLIRDEINDAKVTLAQQRAVLNLQERDLTKRFGNKPMPHRIATRVQRRPLSRRLQPSLMTARRFLTCPSGTKTPVPRFR